MVEQDGSEALAAARPDLIALVLRHALLNPYWLDRFGERGRQYTEQDTGHLLENLETALVFGEVVLVDYTRWLQGLLIRRGLCTLHLHQTLVSVRYAARAHLPQPLQVACGRVLRAGMAALHHPPPGGEVQDAAPGIVAALPPLVPPIRGEGAYYLSFLADALILQSEDQLVAYLAWSEGYYGPRHGRDLAQLRAALAASAALGPARATLQHALGA